MTETIYLDHNATTPLLPCVAKRLVEARAAGYANPSSQHSEGRRARRALETARESLTQLLGGRTDTLDADQLVFTSGGTEANTLALRGLVGPPGGTVLISSIEHPSIAETADQLLAAGYRVERIRCDASGVTSVAHTAELLEQFEAVQLVSLMLANNETGVVQPVSEVARLCRQAGVPMHTDAVQAVGKQPLAFGELGVTALSFTAHKFHGPRGVGGLLLQGGARLTPQLFGGPQQGGLRAGTEVVDLALGAEAALEAWFREATDRWQRMTNLRDRFEQRLLEASPFARVIACDTARLPHTSCVAFPGCDRQALVMALDLAGVACSTGSACSSGSSEPSPTLVAMGLPRAIVGSALRFSLGAMTTAAELDVASERISKIANDLEQRENARLEA